MSNGSSSSYVGACRKDIPYPSVSSESVPSLIDNLVTALYGTITKSVINRRVVWNIPCDPNNTAIVSPAFPRLAGEGLLCYIMRVFEEFISGGSEVFSPFLNWTFTGNGSTTIYSLPDATALLPAAYLVYIDGVVQAPVNYTIASGNPLTIVFSTAIPNGSQVVIVCMGTASTGEVSTASVVATGSTTPRTLANRFADVVNVKDFGAVGDGVTDNLSAFNAAIAASSNRLIVIPVDTFGGDYAVTSGTLTIPSGKKLLFEGGSRIFTSGSGVIVNNSNTFVLLGGGVGETRSDTITKGFAVELNEALTGTGASNTYQLNRIRIASDQLDAVTDASAGTKVDGLLVQHTFGGVGTKGGRHAIESILSQSGVTDVGNTDSNYCGLATSVQSNVGDRGTVGSPLGSYFGLNANAFMGSGATNTFHVNGCEFDVGIDSGGSTTYRCGSSFVSCGNVQGTDWDAGVSISAIGGAGITPWRDAILIGYQNGNQPVSRSLIRNASGASTFFSNQGTIPNNLIVSDTDATFNLTKSELKVGNTNGHIILGSASGSNTPYIDFLSSGAGSQQDIRIIASGGTSTNQQGTLVVNSGTTAFSGVVRGSGDGAQNLGSATNRWATVFAVTGTINTSDEREKQQIEPIEPAVILAWKKVNFRQFKFNDAVEKKGDEARFHVGVIAQQVKEAFESEGLDAFEYGILCYDEWDAQEEIKDDEGNVIQPAREAGNRYGVRYEEALALECAYQRVAIDSLIKRIEALEASN